MNNEIYYKLLIGKKVLDLTMNRKGIVNHIVFNNSDWSICWLSFKWEHGEYMRQITELEIIEPRQLSLF
jgi:hypothetical protein